MINFISQAEIEELCEAMLSQYRGRDAPTPQRVDIDGFVQDYLKCTCLLYTLDVYKRQGMETTRIREGRLELQKLDKLIYEKIPSGFSIRDKTHRYLSQIDLSELCCARHVDLLRAEKSIGTLGGGNQMCIRDRYGFCQDLDQNEDGSIGSLADVLWQSTVWYFWWD